MKIKRFLAKDMRTALAQVKETLGSDAVIMSNKKVTGGIEIVAAVDYDEPKPKGLIAEKSASSPTFMDLAEEKISLGLKRPVRSEARVKPAPAADSLQALLERQQSRVEQHVSQHSSEELDMPEWAKGLQAPQSFTKSSPCTWAT